MNTEPLRYIAYTPKCTPKKGAPWLAVGWTRSRRKDVLPAFCPDPNQWKNLRKAGWSIVRVEVIAP